MSEWRNTFQHFGDLYSCDWVIETLMSGPVLLVTIFWGLDYFFPSALMSLLLMANINNMFYWKYKADRIAAVLRDTLKHIWQLTVLKFSFTWFFFCFILLKKLSQCQLVLRDQWISSWCCLHPEKQCLFNSKYGFIFLFTPWQSKETSPLPIIMSCRS